MNTVLQSFDQFRMKLELTAKEKTNIQRSHRDLRSILEQTKSSPPIINTLLHGSWKRRTTIQPINDVDILAILDPDYVHTYFWGMVSEFMKPQTVLKGIRKRLLSKYPNSRIRTDRPCIIAVINNSIFEILPVYELEYGYKMPNDNLTGWKSADPDKLADRITTANYNNDGKLIPLIKMLKHWKNNYLPSFPSFKLEEITCDIFDPNSISTLSRWSKELFEDWRYIFHDKSIESYPYGVSYWFERFRIILASQVSISLNDNDIRNVEISTHLANKAYRLWEEGYEHRSIEKWFQLFGKPFPF